MVSCIGCTNSMDHTMMKRLLTTTFFSLFASTSAFATTILIDDFSVDQRVIDVPTGNIPTSSEVEDAGIFGGARDLSVSTDNGATDATELRVLDGIVGFSNIAGESGIGAITYDGIDGDGAGVDLDGLGGIDLTFNGRAIGFQYDVLSADNDLEVIVNIWDTDENLSQIFFTVPEDFANLTFTGSFDNAIGDADLTSVGAFQFIATGGENLDATIRSISVSIIPLPATGAMLLGALLMGGTWSRYRKRAS